MTPRPLMHALPIVALAAIIVLAAGCSTTAPPREVAPDPQRQFEAPPPEPMPPPAQEPPPPAPSLRTIEPGTGRFINEEAASRPVPGPGPAGEVTFNFEGESLHAVVKAILGDFLQQNYVMAPGVQGTVTFSTAQPLRADQALSILEMLLRWNNATLVWENGRYTILPVAQAIPGNLVPRMGPLANQRGFEVRAVPLEFISATEMEKLLKPYAKPDAIVSVDNQRRMIVLAGTRSELANYLQTIEIFDVDWLAGMSVGIFPLQQTEVGKIIPQLEEVFGTGADTPLAGLFRFLPLEGINSVLVITSRADYLERAEDFLDKLDIGIGEVGQRLYVYEVKNVKAADLADTLGSVFGVRASGVTRSEGDAGDLLVPGLEPVEVSTVGSGDVRTPSRRRDAQPGGAGATGDGPSGPVVDSAGGISLAGGEDIGITAVEESNSLLIRSTATQWESIRRAIDRLDVIPLQVHIEAKVIRVALNDSLRYGVEWFFEEGIAGLGSTSGGDGEDGEGEGTDPIGDGTSLRDLARNRDIWGDIGGTVGSGGVNWTFVGPNSAAVIQALDDVSDVTVVSAPSLVVLNNKQASINVGSQIPVASTYFNPVGGGSTPGTGDFQQTLVQFRQVGVQLDVTPRVNPGGLVFMEISQTESEPGSGDAVGGNSPVDNRDINTEVAVQSGQTVVLGGLIRTQRNTSEGGVPFLSRIPILGALFGTKSEANTREELLVMITPTVIRNPQDAADLAEEYRSKFRALEPLRTEIEPRPVED